MLWVSREVDGFGREAYGLHVASYMSLPLLSLLLQKLAVVAGTLLYRGPSDISCERRSVGLSSQLNYNKLVSFTRGLVLTGRMSRMDSAMLTVERSSLSKVPARV